MASHRVEVQAAELTRPKSGSKDTYKDTMLEENVYEPLIFLFQTCSSEFPLAEG